jgi:hypothetical protein
MAESKEKIEKQHFMKEGTGNLFVAGQLVTGIRMEKVNGSKNPKIVYIPLTKEQVALFTKAQIEQYLELR